MGKGRRALLLIAVFAFVAVVPQWSLAAGRVEGPDVEILVIPGDEGVTGAAAGAASAAGGRAEEPLTQNMVAAAGVALAGTGAMIVAGPPFMAWAAGVSAVGLLGLWAVDR